MASTRNDGVGAAEMMDGTTTVLPKGADALAEPVGMAESNNVLEHDASTKGQWFQYVRTKQFWITLVLGQGEFLFLFSKFSRSFVASCCELSNKKKLPRMQKQLLMK